MKYKPWTKIDSGNETAWKADVWLKTLKIIQAHQGEQVYDQNSAIYEHLKRDIPELSWVKKENKEFRPYFRDFSKPWVLTGVASFNGTFKVETLGTKLLNSEITLIDFWINFLSSYEEENEYPFRELSEAFLKLSESVSHKKIYWGIVTGYRASNEVVPDLKHISSAEIPVTPKRRLTFMLELLELSGGIISIGKGSEKRWMRWDQKALQRIAKGNIVGESHRSAKFTCLSKPFLLLAGISGTGKTRFVREQAKATGSISETYRLIPVRPDWHEPSDILGYISRLSGEAQYITTEVLQFIAKAWRALIDANLDLKLDETDGKLIVTGDITQLDEIPPYWLCLDEMNLAPVEQYFADYLSILETREWGWKKIKTPLANLSTDQWVWKKIETVSPIFDTRQWLWNSDTFDYSCDPLLSASIIKQVSDTQQLRKDLGFADGKYDKEWGLFFEYGMSIPFNLIVAGTVNMDETTHGFSRKVIDRALSFDFGEFFPNNFDQFFTPTVQNKVLSYPIHSQATIDKLPKIDNDGLKSIAFLNAINTILSNTPFELAYRALNELLLAVISSQPADNIELQAVWDDFLMCKVLPRIEGDQDKLMVIDEKISTNNPTSLLDQLANVLQDKLKVIWNEPKGSKLARPDLYREAEAVNDEDQVLRIACRSKAKIAWMQTRLARSSFTSFWP